MTQIGGDAVHVNLHKGNQCVTSIEGFVVEYQLAASLKMVLVNVDMHQVTEQQAKVTLTAVTTDPCFWPSCASVGTYERIH